MYITLRKIPSDLDYSHGGSVVSHHTHTCYMIPTIIFQLLYEDSTVYKNIFAKHSTCFLCFLPISRTRGFSNSSVLTLDIRQTEIYPCLCTIYCPILHNQWDNRNFKIFAPTLQNYLTTKGFFLAQMKCCIINDHENFLWKNLIHFSFPKFIPLIFWYTNLPWSWQYWYQIVCEI